MEKVQILFPEPQLARLRQAAKVMDRPVSELVRAAVDAWLAANAPPPRQVREAPPVYGLGEMQTAADALRDRAWEDRREDRAES
jgi:hypothetical protein